MWLACRTLSKGLKKLQNAQKLIEQLSSNLGEAAQSLSGTATSHSDFIKSAQATTTQLGEVIKVLKDLDTKSINASLSEIGKDLEQNTDKLTNVATALSRTEKKATDSEAKLDLFSKKLEKIIVENATLSKKLADAQKAIISSADEAALTAGGRHKAVMFLLLISAAASVILVTTIFRLLPN